MIALVIYGVFIQKKDDDDIDYTGGGLDNDCGKNNDWVYHGG
jgi:hypothetical protein